VNNIGATFPYTGPFALRTIVVIAVDVMKKAEGKKMCRFARELRPEHISTKTILKLYHRVRITPQKGR
jgi:hypothetical protein